VSLAQYKSNSEREKPSCSAPRCRLTNRVKGEERRRCEKGRLWPKIAHTLGVREQTDCVKTRASKGGKVGSTKYVGKAGTRQPNLGDQP